MTDIKQRSASIAISGVKVLAASILLALSAQVSFYLPLSPVPVTAQTFALIFLSLMLGRKAATATVLVYFAQGLAGLPVFAGGFAGVAAFVRPAAGFLVGCLPVAFFLGWCADKGCLKSVKASVGAVLAGSILLYAFGSVWLSLYVPASKVWAIAIAPFWAGDVLKAGAALSLARFFHKK
ncbi:MAG: biotin transporter BioY [Brevinema sp.]